MSLLILDPEHEYDFASHVTCEGQVAPFDRHYTYILSDIVYI